MFLRASVACATLAISSPFWSVENQLKFDTIWSFYLRFLTDLLFQIDKDFLKGLLAFSYTAGPRQMFRL